MSFLSLSFDENNVKILVGFIGAIITLIIAVAGFYRKMATRDEVKVVVNEAVTPIAQKVEANGVAIRSLEKTQAATVTALEYQREQLVRVAEGIDEIKRDM